MAKSYKNSTWVKVPPYNDGKIHFEGLNVDAPYLPKKTDEPKLSTGDSAMGLSDEGCTRYHYEGTTDKWYKL